MIEIIEKQTMEVLHKCGNTFQNLCKYLHVSHIYVDGRRYKRLESETTVGENTISIYVALVD